jgi:plastocyanin
MMGDLASGKTMTRSSCAFALLAFALLAAPAQATDASVTFRCCQYTPNSVRILPGEKVTIAPDIGVAFENHPLHYTDDVGNTLTGTTPAERTFPQAGIYQWYCGIHGHYDGVTVSGMSGRVAVTTNHLPVASFTAGSTDVAPGTEVTFDASGSSDADLAQSLNYSWDLDGDGIDDPGQTAVDPSAVFTNTGTTPRQVTVRLTATDTNSDEVGPESATKTMVITVQPPPAPPAAPPGGSPPPLPAADTTAPKLALTLAKSLTVRSKLRLPFTTDEPASVTASLKVGARTARATREFAAAGKHALTVKLSKAIRRSLRHRRKVTLTLAVTDDAGNGTTVRRTLKLKSRQL